MDYYRDSSNPVAARLFWFERKFKIPKNRQLDPYSDRYCRDTDHIALARDVVNLSVSTIKPGLSKLMNSSSC